MASFFDFKGYNKSYFIKGLSSLEKKDSEELLNFAYNIDYINYIDPYDRDMDIYCNMYFTTGDNSNLMIDSYNGHPQKFVVNLYDQVFESESNLKLKVDYVYLREVIMVLDYCATKLTQISEQEGYDKANNSELNALMTKLKVYLKETVNGKNPERLDVDFKNVLGEHIYIDLQNKCKLKALKTKCISEGRIPPESDKIKYPDSYDKFCMLLPEIEKVYSGIDENIKEVQKTKNDPNYTIQDIKRRLYEERAKLKGLKKQVRSKKTYFDKTEDEKVEIRSELMSACLKSKMNIENLKFKRAVNLTKLKFYERKLKVDNTRAIAKIQNILAKNTWVDFQK